MNEMIGVVIMTHGNLAQEFVRAAEHVLGPQKNLIPIGIHPNDDPEKRREEASTAIKKIDIGAGVVVMSDMFGGTPSNLALSLLDQGKCEVIAGINLPLLIKLLSIRETTPLTQAVLQAQEAGKNYITLASGFLAAHG